MARDLLEGPAMNTALTTSYSAPPLGKSQIAALALGGAALVTLLGLATKSWLSAGYRGGVGLLGVESCGQGACRSAGWGELGHMVSADVVALGYASFVLGLIVVGAGIATAVITLQGKAPRIPRGGFQAANAVLGVTAFVTTSFLMRLLMSGRLGSHASVGYSGIFAIGGLVAIGAIVKKLVQPLAAAAAPEAPATAPLPQ
jgi:hypothetical protein